MKIRQGTKVIFILNLFNFQRFIMKNLYNFILFLLVSAFLFIAGCQTNQSTSPDYPPSCLKGKVTDAGSHNPLAGVNITTIPGVNVCLSDTGGNYFLSGIPMSSSGTNLIIVASRIRYLTDTIPYFLLADDTAIVNIELTPSNGIFYANNLDVYQNTNPSSYSSLDFGFMITRMISSSIRDLDLMDSMGLGLQYRFISSSLYGGYFDTRAGNSLGKFTKYQFDTLAKIYDAGDSIQDSYFSKDRTGYFAYPLAENSVYPVYLYGRYLAAPTQPKTYGLLYINSTRIENGLFVVTVDIKVNRNGMNYFIPNTK